MKKLGFALGAGGSRGVAHIGFLEAMEEEGIKPDYITGCSMGAIVGGAYAAGVSIEQIKHVVLKLRLLDFISPRSKKGGFFGSKKIWKLVEKYMKDITLKDICCKFSYSFSYLCMKFKRELGMSYMEYMQKTRVE